MDYSTTCITNIYNEEYLLPFWLNHHKNMFDNFIIIDHHSTDNSINICKEIIPTCNIIKHPSREFASKDHDIYLMKLERAINGIKIILNTTEFLFCNVTIKQLFKLYANNHTNYSLQIPVISPYSSNKYYPKNNYELLYNLKNKDVVFHYDREGGRYIHNYSDGNYEIGRHWTYHNFKKTKEMIIIWFGFYPFNDKLLTRKLQVKDKIPERDKIPKPGFPRGFGWQHFLNKNTLIDINTNKSKSGVSILETKNKEIKHINVFNFILKHIIDLSVDSSINLSHFYK